MTAHQIAHRVTSCKSHQATRILENVRLTAGEVESMRSEQWDRIEQDVKAVIVFGLESLPRCAPGCVPAWAHFSVEQKTEILSRCRVLEKVAQRCAVMR